MRLVAKLLFALFHLLYKFIIKKSRLHKKSRFFHQLIPKGYNLYLISVLQRPELRREHFELFLMVQENAVTQKESYDPIPLE